MDDLAVDDRQSRNAYDGDFAAWAFDQAARLRLAAGGGAADLDWENLAEEIEALAKRDRRELASHIRTVAEHLIKLQASPAASPREGREQSISHARGQIDLILADSPSLRSGIADAVNAAMPGARRAAQRALGRHDEVPRVRIEQLDYTPEQVIGDWWP